MINLLNLEPSKVSIALTGYSVVFMGETGEGKTYSLNEYLKSTSPVGKSPLVLTFEDRYENLANIFVVRIHSISEFLTCVGQLRNPRMKEKYSCIIIDTIDTFEEMASRYNASNKEVQILEELSFGKGKRYLSETIGYVNELKNLGYPVHYTAQSYKNTDIITKQTTVATKLKDTTKAQIFNQAYLVGHIGKDPKAKNPEHSDRLITFEKTNVYTELKDTFGLPSVLYVSELKDSITKVLEQRYEQSALTYDSSLEVIEEETFEEIKKRGNELGRLLSENGYLNEATNILKVEIGCNEDGSAKMFDSLLSSQMDLIKVIVFKMEDLVRRYNLK